MIFMQMLMKFANILTHHLQSWFSSKHNKFFCFPKLQQGICPINTRLGLCFSSVRGGERSPSGLSRPLLHQEDCLAIAKSPSCFCCHHQHNNCSLNTHARKSRSFTNRLIPFLAHFQIKISNGQVSFVNPSFQEVWEFEF